MTSQDMNELHDTLLNAIHATKGAEGRKNPVRALVHVLHAAGWRIERIPADPVPMMPELRPAAE